MSDTSKNQSIPRGWNQIITDSSLDSAQVLLQPGPNLDIFYQEFKEHDPELVQVDKMLLRDILDGLESGLESTREELSQHDSSFGRTTRKNQNYADLLENEIRKIKITIEKVKKLV